MKGKTLGGRYYIIDFLGGGAFGNTYLSEDRQRPNNPLCVVKQLIPQVVNQITLRLFNSEAKVLEKLGNHDQIPRLYAYFQEDKEFYLVQEFIPGHNLDDEIIPNQQLSENNVIKLLREILEVLDFVHQQNVIHRDLKPNNIRRREDGKIVLIDFGAVKEINSQVSNLPIQTNLSTVSIGTPGYMPSEQSNGKPKLSSDIYAIGMIGIQALTGIFPHQLPENPKTGEIMWRNYTQVSNALANVLDKMIRYDFRQRYQSAVETLADINSLIDPVNPTLVAYQLKTLAYKTNSSSILSPINISRKDLIVTGIVGSILVYSVALFTNLFKPTNVISNDFDTKPKQSENNPPKITQVSPNSVSINPISIKPNKTLNSEPIQTNPHSNEITQSKLNIFNSKNTTSGFYFISDAAYKTDIDANKQLNRLKIIGYTQAFKLWIPDYPNLSRKSLFVISPAIFTKRDSCAEFLQTYAQQKPEAYCAFASKNSSDAADRFYASNNRIISSNSNIYPSQSRESEGFYFVSDSAFPSASEADKESQKLIEMGYGQSGKFWIPDYPNLSGKPLFVVYPAQFRERQSCANFLENYRKQSKSSYCAFASKDKNVSADRF